MTWTRFSDDTADNRHVIRAGPLAAHLWWHAVLYCNRNLTDGFVPEVKIRALVDWHGIFEAVSDGRLLESHEPVKVAALVERLTTVGLLVRADGGYDVRCVDGQELVAYLEQQPSAKEVRRDRRRVRSQRSAAGRASAKKRQRDGQRNVNETVNEIATGAQRDG